MRAFFVFLPFFFACIPLSFAQGETINQQLTPAFVVKSFEVTESNGPIYTMRERAIKKARKPGLEKLLKQITPRKTWGVHNQILAVSDIDKLFYKAVVDFEEITSRYKASIHLFYNEKAVKSLLEKYGVPYTKATGGKVLLLPVFEYGENLVMWENTNPVKNAVERSLKSSFFFDFSLPKGSVDEVNSLSSRLAVLGAGDLITSIANRYDTEAAVVLHVKLSNRFDGFYLDVSANWFEGDLLVEPVIYSAPIDGLVLFDGFPDEEKLSSYLDVAVRDVLSRVGEHKRDENLVEVDKPGRVFLRFKPQDPSDLEELQNKITSLGVIKEFKLRVLNVKDSVFQIDFYGDKQELASYLQKLNIDIKETSMPMVWKVSFKNDPFLGPVEYNLDLDDEGGF